MGRMEATGPWQEWLQGRRRIRSLPGVREGRRQGGVETVQGESSADFCCQGEQEHVMVVERGPRERHCDGIFRC